MKWLIWLMEGVCFFAVPCAYMTIDCQFFEFFFFSDGICDANIIMCGLMLEWEYLNNNTVAENEMSKSIQICNKKINILLLFVVVVVVFLLLSKCGARFNIQKSLKKFLNSVGSVGCVNENKLIRLCWGHWCHGL
jgi:hypothetical protein